MPISSGPHIQLLEKREHGPAITTGADRPCPLPKAPRGRLGGDLLLKFDGASYNPLPCRSKRLAASHVLLGLYSPVDCSL